MRKKQIVGLLALAMSAVMFFEQPLMTLAVEGGEPAITEEVPDEDNDVIPGTEEDAAPGTEEDATPGTEDEATPGTEDDVAPSENPDDTDVSEEPSQEPATDEETTDNSIEGDEEVNVDGDEIPEEMATPEEDDNWMGSGHKAPKLEMNLTSAMVAEKKELQGTAARLENLQKDVNYAGNQAVFLASSKSYAEEVAEGYGAELISFEDGVAVITFQDDVTEILSMAEDPNVMLPAVYPNFIYTTCDDVEMEQAVLPDDVDEDVYTTQAAANKPDPLVSNKTQYYHDEIGAPAAWAYNPAAGKGVKVAVIDSGIEKGHEDLKGRVASASTTVSGDYFNTGGFNGAADNDAHGTHVSGIIAANYNNGLGGAGIAHNASIVSIKALEELCYYGTASGNTADIIKAVNKSVSSGARVINMSLGGPYYDPLYEASVNNAINKGVVVVVAAGNENTQLSNNKSSKQYCSPACFDNVITVSAKTQGSATKASFSNYGNGIIDITAPGTGIYSTVPKNLYGTPYGSMNGTSQATPMVAAAAAYILSVSPDLMSNKSKASVDTVKSILKNSATKSGYSNTSYFGAGLLNVDAAIKMAAPSAQNNTELKAPQIKLGGAELTKNQVIQDTDMITLSATLGAVSDPAIKIYYTTDGKAPKEEDKSLYKGSFNIPASGTKTIKAMAVYYGKKSKVASVSVKVNANVRDYSIHTKLNSSVVSSGKSAALVADEFDPAYATKKSVKWSIIAGGENATLSGSTLKAKAGLTSPASVTVQAKADDAGGVVKTLNLTIVPQIKSLKLTNAQDSKITLTYPTTKQMNITTDPAGISVPIQYTSSNTKVATVSGSGLISPVGAGKATITAKTLDGSNKSVKMTVTVERKVDSVTVKSKTEQYQIAAGKTLQMVAEVTANATNKKVTWSVTPETAASISASGSLRASSVTAVTTVTVKATAVDGSGVYGTRNVSIYPANTPAVLLEEKTSQVLAITASGSLSNSIQLHPYTRDFSANSYGRAQGSGSSNLDKFTYVSSNKNVATVSSTGLVTAQKNGTAKIKITANDGSGKSIQCTIKVITPILYLSLYSKTGRACVGKGKKVTLGASLNTYATIKKLKWTSSNEAVAKVDQKGGVKGISNGSATITAAATDGSGIYNTYTITVIPAVKSLVGKTSSGLYVSPSRLRYTMDYHSGVQGICMAYYNTDSTSTYTSANKGPFDVYATKPNILRIETDDDGYYYMFAVNKGVGEVTWKAMDGSGKKCTFKVQVK